MSDARRPGFSIQLSGTTAAQRRAELEAAPKVPLSFLVRADLPFGTLLDYAAAYFDVVGPVTHGHIADAMFPLWIAAQERNDNRLAAAAFWPLLAEGVRFHWPAFDEARARFLAAGQFPGPWKHLADAALDRRRSLRREAVDLLPRTVMSTVCNRQRARQALEARYARVGLHLFDQDAEPFVRGFEASLDLSNPATLPPYFPGDSTTIRAIRSGT
jgi:hypothetical protein